MLFNSYRKLSALIRGITVTPTLRVLFFPRVEVETLQRATEIDGAMFKTTRSSSQETTAERVVSSHLE